MTSIDSGTKQSVYLLGASKPSGYYLTAISFKSYSLHYEDYAQVLQTTVYPALISTSTSIPREAPAQSRVIYAASSIINSLAWHHKSTEPRDERPHRHQDIPSPSATSHQTPFHVGRNTRFSPRKSPSIVVKCFTLMVSLQIASKPGL